MRGSAEFYKVLKEMADLHAKKNNDYARKDDPLSNLRACERMGIPAWMGVLIRMTDKMSRLEQIASGNEIEIQDETIEDTLKDIANYSALAVVLWREKNHK